MIMKQIKSLLSRELKINYSLYFMFSILLSMKNVILLIITYYGIDIITDGNISEWVISGNVGKIVGVASCGIILFLVSLLTNFYMNRTCELMEKDIYGAITKRSSKFSLFELMDSTKQAMIRDSLESSASSFSGFLEIIPCLFESFIFLIIYIFIGTKTSAIYLIVSVLAMFLSAFLVSKNENAEYDNLQHLSDAREKKKYYSRFFMNENNHSEVVAHQSHMFFVNQIDENDKMWNQNLVKKKKCQKRNSLICSSVLGVFMVMIVLYLYSLVMRDRISISYAVVMGLASVMLFSQMESIVNNLIYAKEALYYIRQYNDCINYPIAKEDFYADKVNEIKVNNISYSFGEKEVLRNMHLSIRKGEKVLLLGENGAGKTTFLNIMMGLYPKQAGTFWINNKECESSIMHKCACVSQDFPMIHGTIKENLFADDYSDEEVYQVLKKVDLYDKVMSFDNGIHHVFDSEDFLSYGQLQRLAIARLLLRNDSDIWVLDEPTSAMDAIHEDKILKRVFEAGQDKLIIIVTHRLGMAKLCDRIYHVQDGEIDYFGTHSDLYDNCEQYRLLFEGQAKMYGI